MIVCVHSECPVLAGPPVLSGQIYFVGKENHATEFLTMAAWYVDRLLEAFHADNRAS